jgi:hypothetical protein
VLLGLVLSFGFIRMSTRMIRSPRFGWWPGNIETGGGVHLHHLVFGIVTMMVAGTISFAGFAVGGIYEACAFLFGVGVGLTIDEFALWVRLDDVYWAEEGRRSVDAAVIAICLLGLIVLGVRPFDFDGGSAEAIVGSLLAIAFQLAMVFVSFLKGRTAHALFGFFVFPLAWYAACRIGKPHSAWARRHYGERNPGKQTKAERRFQPQRRTERFKESLRTAIGGSTESDFEKKVGRR